MAKKIKIENLAKEITETLKEFEGATDAVIEEAVTKTAKDAVKELKKAKPPGSGHYNSWNEYNKSWKVMQTKTDKRYNKKATIHNQNKYNLTHLLEKGHALVNGGRKVGETGAFEHIAPVAEKAEKKLMDNIKKGIENA